MSRHRLKSVRRKVLQEVTLVEEFSTPNPPARAALFGPAPTRLVAMEEPERHYSNKVSKNRTFDPRANAAARDEMVRPVRGVRRELRHWDEPQAANARPRTRKVRTEGGGAMFGAKRRVRASEGDGVEDHQALAWGWGGEGRLGTGGLNAEDLAAPVAHSRHLGGHFVDVASSRRHSLMCTEHGKVYAFGEGVHGNLGSKRVPRDFEIEQPDSEEEQFTVFKKTHFDAAAHRAALAAAKAEAENASDAGGAGDASKVGASGAGQGAGADAAQKKAQQRELDKEKRRRRKKKAAEASSNRKTPARRAKEAVRQSLDNWLLDNGRQLLRFPRASFPSGELKRGRDYWIAQVSNCPLAPATSYGEDVCTDEIKMFLQVAAGDGTSYAREACAAEGRAACVGLARMLRDTRMLERGITIRETGNASQPRPLGTNEALAEVRFRSALT